MCLRIGSMCSQISGHRINFLRKTRFNAVDLLIQFISYAVDLFIQSLHFEIDEGNFFAELLTDVPDLFTQDFMPLQYQVKLSLDAFKDDFQMIFFHTQCLPSTVNPAGRLMGRTG